ncbi:MAG: discoidin domain-containing protein [Bacteroidota bacterium]
MRNSVCIIILAMVFLRTNGQVNVAVNQPVAVDSEINGQQAWKAVDGLNYSNSNRWVSDNSGYPHWIEVDLQEEYLLSSINFYTGYYGDNHPVHDYRLLAWTGAGWSELVNVSGNIVPQHIHSFEPVAASKVRLEALSGEGDELMMYELEVFALLNLAPEIDPVQDQEPLYWDEGMRLVPLSGIGDGDPDSIRQLSVTAYSSDHSVADDPVVTYIQGDSTAILSWTPAGEEGTATITVRVSDDGGTQYQGTDTCENTFKVTVRDPEKNYPPTLDAVADIYAFSNGSRYTVNLTGISDGDHNRTQDLVLEAIPVDEDLIGDVQVAFTPGDSSGILQFSTTSAEGTGSLVLRLKDSGGTDKGGIDSLLIPVQVVVTPQAGAVRVTADLLDKRQVMEGFGGFGFETVSWARGPYYSDQFIDDIINDLGVTILRVAISPLGFEPVNDNGDPLDTDLEAFTENVYNNEDWKMIDYIRDVGKVAPDIKVIASSWSPPAWMKSNNNTSEGGILLPEYYEEYAEYITAYIKVFKQETGLDLYAVSLQNEPTFWEPYESCQYTPRTYCDLIRVVGERFDREGITTRLFYPEEVMPRESDMEGWMNTLNNDAYAREYVDIVAVHGYERTGVSAGEIGGELWQKYYNDYVNYPGYPKQFWMSETSGQPNTHEGAIRLMTGLSHAITYGRLNAWVYWTISGNVQDPLDPEHVYDLMLSGVKLRKYYASKNYYRYVRPGAVSLATSSSDIDVLVNAFWNGKQNSLTYVLVNRSDQPRVVHFDSYPMTTDAKLFRTSPGEDCEPVTIPAGSEVHRLPAKSVSTFVLSGGGYANRPPTIDAIPDTTHGADPDSLVMVLHGITDGDDDKEQELLLTAAHSNPGLVDKLVIEPFENSDSARLVLYFHQAKSGEALITVEVTENDPLNTNQFLTSIHTSFTACVIYTNKPPVFDVPDKATVYLPGESQEILITGVDDGNKEAEEELEAGFWTEQSACFAFDSLVYVQGDTLLSVWVTPTAEGTSLARLSLTDNGDITYGENHFEGAFYIKVVDLSTPVVSIPAGDVVIYPNPADQRLSVRGTGPFSKYTVVDVTGHQVVMKNLTGDMLDLDTSRYTEGIYTLRLEGPNDIRTIRFAVVR